MEVQFSSCMKHLLAKTSTTRALPLYYKLSQEYFFKEISKARHSYQTLSLAQKSGITCQRRTHKEVRNSDLKVKVSQMK